MRILIFGGRDFGRPARGPDDDKPNWLTVYQQHCAMQGISKQVLRWAGGDFWTGKFNPIVISGCATGADRMGEIWAERHGYPVVRFPADWDRYGKRAGFLRNQQMLNEGKPDYAIEFPGGNGTRDMHTRLERAGVQIHVVGYTAPSGRVSIWPRSDAWQRRVNALSAHNSRKS